MSHGSEPLQLTVNDEVVEVDVHPLTPLAHVLREALGLTGTKLGCGGGDCGSCTVLVGDMAAVGHLGGARPITACLVPVAHVTAEPVTTIEGLAGIEGPERLGGEHLLHPVQEAFQRNNASQCGYCIPGIVMASVELIARDEPLERAEIKRLLAGNLCRCTGYETIIDAIIDAQRTRIEVLGTVSS